MPSIWRWTSGLSLCSTVDPSGPGSASGRSPLGQVARGKAGREREADRGGHVVAPAQGPRRALGHDAPGRQHRDPVGQVLRLVHVVGGEEDRLAELPQPGDDLPGGPAGGRVEPGGRLVEEDELGVADQREREVEPPPLAAGQPRAERARLPGEADQGDGLVDVARRRGRSRRTGPGTRAPTGRARARIPARRRRPGPATPRRRWPGRAPRTRDLAAGAPPEAFEDLHRGGLARAVRAEEGEDLPAPHVEVDACHGLAGCRSA